MAGLCRAADRAHHPRAREYAKVSLPGGAPWVEMDCEWEGRSFKCGGPNFPGVIVPVAILDDQDGPCDRNARKTDAFYGNPLAGFTPAP